MEGSKMDFALVYFAEVIDKITYTFVYIKRYSCYYGAKFMATET